MQLLVLWRGGDRQVALVQKWVSWCVLSTKTEPTLRRRQYDLQEMAMVKNGEIHKVLYRGSLWHDPLWPLSSGFGQGRRSFFGYSSHSCWRAAAAAALAVKAKPRKTNTHTHTQQALGKASCDAAKQTGGGGGGGGSNRQREWLPAKRCCEWQYRTTHWQTGTRWREDREHVRVCVCVRLLSRESAYTHAPNQPVTIRILTPLLFDSFGNFAHQYSILVEFLFLPNRETFSDHPPTEDSQMKISFSFGDDKI